MGERRDGATLQVVRPTCSRRAGKLLGLVIAQFALRNFHTLNKDDSSFCQRRHQFSGTLTERVSGVTKTETRTKTQTETQTN